MILNLSIHHQDVAIKVPEGDLVNSDIHETSSYRLGLKTGHKTYIICKVE